MYEAHGHLINNLNGSDWSLPAAEAHVHVGGLAIHKNYIFLLLESTPPFSSHSWSAFLPYVQVMASKTSVSYLARTSLPSSHFFLLTARRAYSHFPPTRRRSLLQRSRDNHFLISRRTFATTPWRGLADVDDSFDPLQQDRESDEVDVCIVGGGMPNSSLQP